MNNIHTMDEIQYSYDENKTFEWYVNEVMKWNGTERNSFSTYNNNNDTIRERKVDDDIIFRNKYQCT